MEQQPGNPDQANDGDEQAESSFETTRPFDPENPNNWDLAPDGYIDPATGLAMRGKGQIDWDAMTDPEYRGGFDIRFLDYLDEQPDSDSPTEPPPPET